MAAQGPIVFWVANHRLHHAFADTDRDPHSPRPQGSGWRGHVKGLWHGHVGWLFDVKKFDWSRHTRDWLADRRMMKINAWYFTLVVLGIVIPGVVGGLVTQSVHGVVGGMLWGGFARIFALDQATWAVNSLGHTIGAREFPVRDGSRNIARPGAAHLGGVMAQQPPRPAGAGPDPTALVAARSGRRFHPAPRPAWSRPQRAVRQFAVRPCRRGAMTAETHSATVSPALPVTHRRPARRESLAKAIVQLNPTSARAKRVVALVTIGIPAVGFAVAVYLIVRGRATALDYVLFGVFYAIQMFGITIGFHRYVAHKSFKTSRFFEGVLMIAGSMALEGPLLFWVSTHRRHHRYADEQGDPAFTESERREVSAAS